MILHTLLAEKCKNFFIKYHTQSIDYIQFIEYNEEKNVKGWLLYEIQKNN